MSSLRNTFYRFIKFFIGYMLENFLTNKFKLKLLSLYSSEKKINFFLYLIKNIYYSYWINNIFLKEIDPNKRVHWQKICLCGLTPNIDWAIRENAPLNDVKYKFIKDSLSKILNNELNHDNYTLIQLGSASGRIIAKFALEYPKVKCIGIDFFEEFIKYSIGKYKNSNLFYHTRNAHELDDIFEANKDKIIILFSIGSSQYLQPEHLRILFNKVAYFKNINLIFSEGFYEDRFNALYSFNPDGSEFYSAYNGGMHYSHKYDEYANKANLIVSEFSFDKNNNACFFKSFY